MTRTRGVIVYPLTRKAYDVPTIDSYARGVNEYTGETFLIHNQGVSYRVTHDKPFRFDDYSLVAKFHTLLEVRRMPVSNGIDLADWIDTFGARLEANFYLAHLVLTNKEPGEEKYNAQVYAVVKEILAAEEE